MISRANPSSPCPKPGCPHLRPCPVHKAKPWPRPVAHAGGGRWRRTRKRIFERDGGHCVYCGAPAEVVDHVLNRARGGSDDDSNLVACCRPCNEKKRQQEARAGRRG